MSGRCLLPFASSEISLLFLLDGKAIRFHVFSYFIYVCLDDWCLFGHQWKKFLEVIFKFLWSIILNFWKNVLKRDKFFCLVSFPSRLDWPWWSAMKHPEPTRLPQKVSRFRKYTIFCVISRSGWFVPFLHINQN